MRTPTPVPETAPGTSGELMDRIYRWQRHIYDATRKYYLFGRDRLIADLAPPASGTVLELGCGTARNLILAARRYPQARFFGVDISAEMLVSARAAIARAGLSERILVAEGDATDFDPSQLFGEARFDRVFLSYSLSMIPPWRAALEAGIGVLAPDGQMHVVDFGQMERYPAFLRAPMRAWLAAFHVTPRADLADALGEAAARAGRMAELVPLHGGYAVYGTILNDAAPK
ncbi:class I SAM-dependent methyltransferase [Stappia indica]|uniref:class I SAM-dependent methyltransferase n=1 Tax=Stappia indica TaxID=538381 RepID=UPI001CD4016D|nr:class I SAM-dependent methyltransferase [Stappia indica]MCA1300414.1 class I SAM-dependent methyltransferase [Stappia indica]